MKIKNIVTVLLVAFILASCAPATTAILPIEPSAPPVTSAISTSTATTLPPSATEAPTQIPTEVPIPAFMDKFIAAGYDKQFENPDRGVNLCYIDYDSLRHTDFTLGDIQILGVYDCYLIDTLGHIQQISFPLAWDNPSIPKSSYHYGNTGSYQKGDFSLAYMWSSAQQIMEFRKKANMFYFQFGVNNDFKNVDPSLQAYWKSALEVVPYFDANFNATGIVNLKDFPNAKHFTIPTHINFK